MLVDLLIVDIQAISDNYDGDRTRVLFYPGACAVVICYSVDDPLSLENVESIWKPDLARRIPETPLILVGTKSDIDSRQVSIEEASYLSEPWALWLICVGEKGCSAHQRRTISRMLVQDE